MNSHRYWGVGSSTPPHSHVSTVSSEPVLGLTPKGGRWKEGNASKSILKSREKRSLGSSPHPERVKEPGHRGARVGFGVCSEGTRPKDRWCGRRAWTGKGPPGGGAARGHRYLLAHGKPQWGQQLLGAVHAAPRGCGLRGNAEEPLRHGCGDDPGRR